MSAHPSSPSLAFDLIAAGKPEEALAALSALSSEGGHRTPWLIASALAARALGRTELLAESVRSLLAQDPGNLWGNLLQGEHLASQGDRVAALSYLMNALRIADQHGALPAALAAEVTKARNFCAQFSGQLENHVRESIGHADTNADEQLALFTQSLDILFGRRQIYLQSPRYYYYPGLPQRQFFPTESFDWVAPLEAQCANIREEAVRLLQDASAFQPYLQSDPDRPRKTQDGMTDNPDWSACYLIRNGQVVGDIAARCPATMAAIQALPLCELPRRSPSVLFSLLKPGAHIPSHCGLANIRLIGHLPVVTPSGCFLRVGNETREWTQGKAWLFDDSIEHEAWNRSNETRIILLFEVWRPELSEVERRAIQSLFRGLDGASQNAPSWDI
ncbi:MAG: aspartyl/asparaginyl beta-hydroxylase domain-containing protein [Burkholderiales bacterium]|nr:aspartyl/asparaginyl beta-hydroxylase domain-containing protein [Burkholderiales bacterium]